jgi:peptidoglycan hydrolase-like protein with peptidoglycan-binding domain
MWGQETDKNCTTLIDSTQEKFPNGIEFAQHVVGTRVDGVWGSNSKESMHSTIMHTQVALHSMGFDPGAIDGFWGPNTQHAYDKARAACHI